MIRYVCLMAYGDALITMSLLEQCQLQHAKFSIIGTDLTERVAGLVSNELKVTSILSDKAAFNTIKERGVIEAWRDFKQARAKLIKYCSSGDVLVFERDDPRNRALKPFGCTASFAPNSGAVYQDRQRQAEMLFQIKTRWELSKSPSVEPRRVLINPCARYRRRWLGDMLVRNVIEICQQRGWELSMVDPAGEYAHFRNELAEYHSDTTLNDAVKLLRQSDLYIGPDSFFIHLAYYFRIPHFGFFYPDHLSFQTPGMTQTGAWASFEQAGELGVLRKRIEAYLDCG